MTLCKEELGVSVCRVKTEMSKEGKLEHKNLLHESKQLCKQTKLPAADILLVTSLCVSTLFTCVLVCVVTFLCCIRKDKPGCLFAEN